MGLNGTLQDRENGTNLSGRVRAKTGTLIEANSISGYLLTQQGRLLIFSVLIDHIDAGTTQVARDAEDDFLEALANE
jgi:D-alanyl-D-alanine carboxypeptidase/D-alanyl-D-alanine-endopeptidase (penicillin-binding protein 4)